VRGERCDGATADPSRGFPNTNVVKFGKADEALRKARALEAELYAECRAARSAKQT